MYLFLLPSSKPDGFESFQSWCYSASASVACDSATHPITS
jgi:hypothetical protein